MPNRAERRRAAKAAAKASINQDPKLRQIFGNEGQEDLTDELITELVTKGFPEADLRDFAKQGAKYSRPRNSIIFPAEWEF